MYVTHKGVHCRDKSVKKKNYLLQNFSVRITNISGGLFKKVGIIHHIDSYCLIIVQVVDIK